MLGTTIFTGVTTLVSKWFDNKAKVADAKAEQKAAQLKSVSDYDTEAVKAMQYSWKDEFITAIIFSPLIVAWFKPEKSIAWIEFVSGMPEFYQWLMMGIVVATFGLRGFFKGKAITSTKKEG